jgi:polysaccharide export outer membrane protein
VIKKLLAMLAIMSALALAATSAWAAKDADDYKLAGGDKIRISVFQNPDLTLETRVSESGGITFPLIGAVQVGGLTTFAAEQTVAEKLRSGNFVKKPQVNIVLLEVRGSQVTVLGLVKEPGRFPLEASQARLSDMIALAGGVTESAGGGTAYVTGTRGGKPFRQKIDIPALFTSGSPDLDIQLQNGAAVYVAAGNLVSVLGQVKQAGRYPLQGDGMRLSEVLTLAGGVTETASDTAIVSGTRDGQPFRKEIDLASILLNGNPEENITIVSGDEVYIDRAPMFYIYGEAQKPGAYRIERNMTVMQALAQGGGLTMRGTQRNLKLVRRNPDGGKQEISPKLSELVRPDDVIYVRESLF